MAGVGFIVSDVDPVAWFSLEFLFHPWPGWKVDLDRIDVSTPKCPEDPDEEREFMLGTTYYAGVLVTRLEPRMVWKLTGWHDCVRDMLHAAWAD